MNEINELTEAIIDVAFRAVDGVSCLVNDRALLAAVVR
jgi:hypothetical protein